MFFMDTDIFGCSMQTVELSIAAPIRAGDRVALIVCIKRCGYPGKQCCPVELDIMSDYTWLSTLVQGN
jgi:hypothetical protein